MRLRFDSSAGRAVRVTTLTLIGAVLVAACSMPPSLPPLPFGPQPAASPAPAARPQAREAPAQSVAVAAARRGDITETLSYSGNVQARSTVNLLPKVANRVERLPVDVGDEVKGGEVVAELERLSLDAAVQQAQAAVSVAEARLATVRAGAKPEDIAQAETAVTAALARLNQVRAGAKPEDVENLQASVDAATSQVDTTRAQLINARLALDDARLRFQQAQSGLGGAGVREEDIAGAAAQLDSARSRLNQVRAGPRPEEIRGLELTLEKERARLVVAEEALDACGDTKTTTRTETETKTSTETKNKSSKTPTPTTKTDTKTKTEQRVESKPNCPDASKDQLEAAVDVQKAAIREAENNLQKARNGPTVFEVQQAEAAVLVAESSLQKLRFGGTSDLLSLQLRVDQAQAEVDRLQSTLDERGAGIVSAQARLASAVNPSVHEVRVAQAAVEQAQAGVAVRQRPFTAEDIQAAAAQVEQAVAALEVQRVQALEALIKAPFDGVVSQRLVSQGAMAALNTPILTLVSRDVEIVLQVEEAKLGRVARGQAASIAVAAYSDELIDGLVQSVSPTADAKSRTFAVRVWPRVQDGRLKDGMFAQVRLTSAPKQALLVPQEALVTRAGRTLAFVVQDGRARSREVQPGINDGKQVEIIQGLAVGDQVVTSGVDTLSDGAAVQVQRGG